MAKQPLVPRHPQNPVGQTDRIKRARSAVFSDIDAAQAYVLDTWSQLPVDRQNGRLLNRSFYEYLISLDQLRAIVDQIRMTLKQGRGRPTMRAQTQASYREGIAKATENLARLSDDYTRTVTQRLGDAMVERRAALAGARVFEFMDGFAEDTAADLGRVLFTAVQDGQNPRDTAKTIRQRFDVSKSRAERIARTEITMALRRGRMDEARDAQDKFGMRVALIHYSALIPDRTRPSHAARHGKIVTPEDQADWYERDGNAINCILPGAKIAGQFVAGSKAWYEGPALRIVTAAGNNVAVTPNHPVLTERGLVPAAEIVKGNNLVTHSGRTPDLTGVSSLNGDLVQPTIEQVFGALSDLGHPVRSGVSAVDFHGDASFMQEDIEVVDAEGVLTFAGHAAISKLLQHLNFVKPYLSCFGFGSSLFSGDAISTAASSGVSGGNTSKPLLGAEPFTLEPLSIAGAPDCQAFLLKLSVEGDAANSMLLTKCQDGRSFNVFPMKGENIKAGLESGVLTITKADLIKPDVKRSIGYAYAISNVLEGFAGLAAFDQVVDVEKFTFTGHVYDLQSVSGLLVADNIVMSNCLCSSTEITLNDDGEPMFGKNLLERLAEQRKRFAPT